MVLVVIESPYAGDVEKNIKYARACLKDCLRRGESPIASHLLYTQEGVLDDNNPKERALGIKAGLDWLSVCNYQVFYLDHGWSKGMFYAYKFAGDRGISVELRRIYCDECGL